ncbi:MAG: efflux RND transporter periplasmic adaptor subunit [Firmicutes bacterium]|nr:efflux RND transporter periplasmic adaptor subunit [Bacillota bacterium]
MIAQPAPPAPGSKRGFPYSRVVLLAGSTVLVLSALTYLVIRSSHPPAPTRYLTAAVHQGALSETDSATGEVVPANTLTVSVPANATLTHLNVHLGQSVAAGSVLATFSDPTLASQVAAQQATVLGDESQVSELSSPAYAAAQQASITEAQDNLNQAENQLAADRALGTVRASVSGTVTQILPTGTTVISGQTVAMVTNTPITAPFSGTIGSVNAHSGQDVTAGTPLVGLSSAALNAKIFGDASQVANFQAQLNKVSLQDSPSQLATALVQAKAELQRDQQTLTQEQQALSGLVVTAPFPGQIVALNSSPTPSGKLLTLDSASLMVSVPVPETQVHAIHVGQPVTITLPALPGHPDQGTVQSLAPVGVYANGVSNFPVNVSLSNSGGILYGMTAQVSIVVQTVKNAWLVPLAAIKTHGSHYFVDILSGNSTTTITRVPVQVLLENATTAAVGSHRLAPADRVITATLTSPSGKLHLKTRGRAVHKGAGRKKGGKATS